MGYFSIILYYMNIKISMSDLIILHVKVSNKRTKNLVIESIFNCTNVKCRMVNGSNKNMIKCGNI